MRDHARAWQHASDANMASEQLCRIVRRDGQTGRYVDKPPAVPGQFASLVIAVAKFALYLDADELAWARRMMGSVGTLDKLAEFLGGANDAIPS